MLTNYPDLQVKNKASWLVAWLLWPLGAFLISLRNQNRNTIYFVFWLFCIFYGWMFIIPDDIIGAADSARYGRDLQIMYDQQLNFKNFTSSLFTLEESNLDIYQPFVTWVVAFFTKDPRWLFMLFAAVFGFFYISNIKLAASIIPKFNTWVLVLFLLGLMMVNPIWNINGVRMWTATHVFLFGILQYFYYNKRQAYFWIFISILFHFSFTFPVAIFLIWKILPRWPIVYFLIFIGTAFLQEIDFQVVKDFLRLLPEIFQGKVNSYYGEEYLENFENGTDKLALHFVIYGWLRKLFLYLWIVISYLFIIRQKNNEPDILNIFSFILIFGAISNIASMLPSGGRFTVIVEFLLFIPIFYIFQNFKLNTQLELAKNVSGVILIYLFVFNVRIGLDYAGIGMLISNPLIGYYLHDQTPIINSIKEFLSP